MDTFGKLYPQVGINNGSAPLTGAPITPTPAQLGAILAAVKAALNGPSFAGGPMPDSEYAIAEFGVPSSGAVTGLNAVTPGLGALIAALNAALPPQLHLLNPTRLRTAHGHARLAAPPPGPITQNPSGVELPPGAPCPSGMSPIQMFKEIDVQQAAARGLLDLSSKGYTHGDSISATGTWGNVPGPLHVVVDMQVLPPPGDTSGGDFASYMKNSIESFLNGRTAITSGPGAGTPVQFTINATNATPGAAATPCTVQVQAVRSGPPFRSWTNELSGTLGIWDLSDTRTFTNSHELGHMLGLDDKYHDTATFAANGKTYPLPEDGLQGEALKKAIHDIAHDHMIRQLPGLADEKYLYGLERAATDPGHGADLMAGCNSCKFLNSDLNGFWASAGLYITSNPGDLFLSKDGHQNMINGAPFALYVPHGGMATLNGLYGYCVDDGRHAPVRAHRFDVLGPAAAQGNATLVKLARLSYVIAAQHFSRRQTFHALFAIWYVTDNITDTVTGPLADPIARKLLTEAGISLRLTLHAPHYRNPGARRRGTFAISKGARRVLPRLRTVKASRKPSLGPASLELTTVYPSQIPFGTTLQLTVYGAQQKVSIALVPAHGRSRILLRRKLRVGAPRLFLSLSGVRPGSYRVVVRSGRHSRSLPLTVSA
jgi:hypothetical protein